MIYMMYGEKPGNFLITPGLRLKNKIRQQVGNDQQKNEFNLYHWIVFSK